MNPFQKMRLMIGRGLVNLIDDAKGLQEIQADILDSETREGIERAQNFGMTSHPPAGSEAFMVAIAGSRDHLVAVAVDNASIRPKNLKQGEVKIYSAHDSFFYLDNEGNARLKCKKFIVDASEKTEITTPEATFSAKATVSGLFSFQNGMAGNAGENGIGLEGDYYITGDLILNGIPMKTHKHPGVVAGGDKTGGPSV